MQKTDEWAKGKPILVAMFAQRFVVNIDELLINFFSKIKNVEPFNHHLSEIIPPKKWLSYYCSNKNLIRLFFTDLKDINRYCSFTLNFIHHNDEIPTNDFHNNYEKFLGELQTIGSPHIQPNLTKQLKETYEAHLAEIESELHGTNDLPPEMQDILKKPEWLFIVTICLPCMFLYREYPALLLRKARLGDIDALDKILRLDKTVIRDPRISRHFHLFSVESDKSKLEILIKALHGGISGKINLQRLKFASAGFISVISEWLGYRLSSTEIRALFDAVAVDRGHGDLIDTDLPNSPEAFSKAIQRERSLWIDIFFY